MIRSRAIRIALCIAVPAIQAVCFYQQWPNKVAIGLDFRLLYAASAAWVEGRNAYDDAVLAETWERRGDGTPVEPPGGASTPNVYPLTVAMLLSPLGMLSYRAALAVWMTVQVACLASILWAVLNGGNGSKQALTAFVLLVVGYPMVFGFAFGNVAIPVAAALFAAVRSRDRPILAGLALGLSLVKYGVAGPVAILYVAQRRWRMLGVALLVQACLISLATSRYGTLDPRGWMTSMIRTTQESLRPGGTNHPATMEKNAVHLELAALLHRLWPPAARLSPAIAAGLTVLLIARLARRGWRSPIDGATEAACLAVALLSFYHRAYDLAGLLALVAWIVARSPWRAAAAMWLGMVIACLPGPVINDSVATGSWAIDALVQPTPAWGLVVLTVGLLTLVGQRPGPSAGRAMPIMPQ